MNRSGIRIAIVGLGFGAVFVPIYLAHPDVQSVAVCDSNPDRLRSTAVKFGIRQQFTDVEEIVQSPDIDAVQMIHGFSSKMACRSASNLSIS